MEHNQSLKMKNADNASYYINKKSEMLKDFEKMFKACKRAIVRKNPAINISRMHQESKRIFLDYLPVLPFIGGKKNRGTTNLVGGAIFLAVIRVLETEKMSERDIGEVVYYSFENFFQSQPKLIFKLMGKLMFTDFLYKKRIKQAEWVKSQNYDGGFVSQFMKGDGKDFDFGQNVLECAICKFYQKHNADQYIKYLCLGDYPMFRAMGIGLIRTQTIGNGGAKCDFRLKKGTTTPSGWPPEKLPEWKAHI